MYISIQRYFKYNDYINGTKRFEENFENGWPKNEIIKYNNREELVEIEIYDKHGVLKESKYPD